jgi:hypothetical protein
MLLCTQLGFFSIVRQSQNPDEIQIQAHCREDLDILVKTNNLPALVAAPPGSDYPWRIVCDPTDLTRAFALMAASITYQDFSTAIDQHPTQHPKLTAYQDLHHRMLEWQKSQAQSQN